MPSTHTNDKVECDALARLLVELAYKSLRCRECSICDVSAESHQSSGTPSAECYSDRRHNLNSIINIARVRRLGLFGHVARFSRDVPASNMLAICCASGDGYPPDPSRRRSSGRRRTTWLDHISSDTGMSLTDAFSLAQDRSQWRAVATVTKAIQIYLTGNGEINMTMMMMMMMTE